MCLYIFQLVFTKTRTLSIRIKFLPKNSKFKKLEWRRSFKNNHSWNEMCWINNLIMNTKLCSKCVSLTYIVNCHFHIFQILCSGQNFSCSHFNYWSPTGWEKIIYIVFIHFLKFPTTSPTIAHKHEHGCNYCR